MIFTVEAWMIPMPDDEEPCEREMVESAEFDYEPAAMHWAWRRLEEGFFVCMWRRETP